MGQRRSRIRAGKWFHLTQVHGADVAVVAGTEAPGVTADAAVTAHADVTLAIATADCAPLALASPEGVLGAVHAGWRGLHAGVVGEAVKAMRSLGATDITCALGPCISVECYEFSGPELAVISQRWGDEVVGKTSSGAPGLDLAAALAIECSRSEVELTLPFPMCTACNPGFFSHRARRNDERQVMLVWK